MDTKADSNDSPTAASNALLRDKGMRLERERYDRSRHPNGPLGAGPWAFWTDYHVMALVPRSLVGDPPEAPDGLYAPIVKWLVFDADDGSKVVDAGELMAFIEPELRMQECRECDGRGFVACEFCDGRGGEECECEKCGDSHHVTCGACDDEGGRDCEACGGSSDSRPAAIGEWIVNRTLLAKAFQVVNPSGPITIEQVKSGPLRFRPQDGSWIVFQAVMATPRSVVSVSFDDRRTWAVPKDSASKGSGS